MGKCNSKTTKASSKKHITSEKSKQQKKVESVERDSVVAGSELTFSEAGNARLSEKNESITDNGGSKREKISDDAVNPFKAKFDGVRSKSGSLICKTISCSTEEHSIKYSKTKNLPCEIDIDIGKSKQMKPNDAARSSLNENKNTSISDFEQLKVIGRGTFGKVILAKSKVDEQVYALKCIKKMNVVGSRSLKYLKLEKRILEQVDHPFIIKMHKTFQDDHKIYFLFDYCNGGELFFHLQRRRRFAEDMVRFYAAQIYLALTYLHKLGVIYRDLKPENLVLDSYGNIKLVDFGLARDEINYDSKLYSVCGTNEYIPPEVINGEMYSFEFDWWGFGVIIYELLFGHPPFVDASGNRSIIFYKICKAEPYYGNISQDTKDLLKLLLDKDPKKRIRPADIPKHRFFKSINFEDIMNLKICPPIIPIVKNDKDCSNFDPIFLRERLNTPKKAPMCQIDHSKFNEF